MRAIGHALSIGLPIYPCIAPEILTTALSEHAYELLADVFPDETGAWLRNVSAPRGPLALAGTPAEYECLTTGPPRSADARRSSTSL